MIYYEKIRDVVEEVLKEFPKTRDDDFLLCIHTYLRMGFAHKIPLGVVIHYDKIDSAPKFESITRCRRQIQNSEGRLRASEGVEKNRMKKQEETREYYSTKSMKCDTAENSYLL